MHCPFNSKRNQLKLWAQEFLEKKFFSNKQAKFKIPNLCKIRGYRTVRVVQFLVGSAIRSRKNSGKLVVFVVDGLFFSPSFVSLQKRYFVLRSLHQSGLFIVWNAPLFVCYATSRADRWMRCKKPLFVCYAIMNAIVAQRPSNGEWNSVTVRCRLMLCVISIKKYAA